MKDGIITVERVGIDQDVVQIVLGPGAEMPSNLSQIEGIFETCFNNNDYEIILNMVNVNFPPTKFIAVIIEATREARQFGGDIKIINLHHSAKNNFVSFNAKNYLAVEESEEYELLDFGEDTLILPKNDVKPEIQSSPIKDNVRERKKYKIQKKQKNSNFSLSENVQVSKIKQKSEVANLYSICDFVIDKAKKLGFDKKELGKLKVTIYEACLNVIEHAYFSNPDNFIEVSVYHDELKIIIVIHDWGEGFEYNPDRDYDVEKAMNDRKTGGFGMHIIQRSVDDIKYESHNQLGNKLYLLKYLPKQKITK